MQKSYAPVNARSGKGKEMKKFWNNMKVCLMEIGRGNRIVLIGYVNGKVGNKEIAEVVGKWGI